MGGNPIDQYEKWGRADSSKKEKQTDVGSAADL